MGITLRTNTELPGTSDPRSTPIPTQYLVLQTSLSLTIDLCESLSGPIPNWGSTSQPESGSFRPWVSFGPGPFGLGRFGQFLGLVVSALVVGSFQPIFKVSHFGPGLFWPKSIETIKV